MNIEALSVCLGNKLYCWGLCYEGDVDGCINGWLVVLRLNVPVNNFSVMSGRMHKWTKVKMLELL